MRELAIYAATAGIAEALIGYEGMNPFVTPSKERLESTLSGEHLPAAVYCEDTRFADLTHLWAVIRLAQRQSIPILIGLQGHGMAIEADFREAGVPISRERDAGAIAAWLATQLGLRQRMARAGRAVIVIAGARGGIGKSLTTALLAEAYTRRGCRTLVVDGDVANGGILTSFRIPSGRPSYMQLKQQGVTSFTPEQVATKIYHHPSGVDFLIGRDSAADSLDLKIHEWQALMAAVCLLDGYDVILVDTGPDYIKRPYAADAARNRGAHIVLPVPPGRMGRTGAQNALDHFAAAGVQDRCLIVMMAPEKGVTISIDQVTPALRKSYPSARIVGTLPRDPHLVSRADEAETYVSPLDDPHRPLSRAAFTVAAAIAEVVGLTLPIPAPASSLFAQLRARFTTTVMPRATTPLESEAV